nr:MAG TPA: hypothetical protein [Caudoviricetes sp.]
MEHEIQATLRIMILSLLQRLSKRNFLIMIK